VMIEGIEQQQIKTIWAIARRIGWGREEVYQTVRLLFRKEGKKRLHDLSKADADFLIQEMRLVSGDEVPGKATYWQKKKIERMREELGWSEAHLHNFIRKVAGVARPEWLERWQARVVIGALEKSLDAKIRRMLNVGV